MKKYIFFLLVSLTLTAVQCKKSTPEDQLPPITTSGANTFGCLVNGKVWLPYGSGNINGLAVSEDLKNYGMNGVRIYTRNRKNDLLDNLDIMLDNVKDTGIYNIYNIVYSDGTMDYGPPLDSLATIKILRCDTIKQIISGTFSFTGTNAQFHKTINITNGRFDLHYPLTIH